MGVMKVRRVVTGNSASGKAIVASDARVEAIELRSASGSRFVKLWGGNRVARFPDAGAPPSAPKWFPPVGGFRFAMFTVRRARSRRSSPV
jgi:hypothetical protein